MGTERYQVGEVLTVDATVQATAWARVSFQVSCETASDAAFCPELVWDDWSSHLSRSGYTVQDVQRDHIDGWLGRRYRWTVSLLWERNALNRVLHDGAVVEGVVTSFCLQ